MIEREWVVRDAKGNMLCLVRRSHDGGIEFEQYKPFTPGTYKPLPLTATEAHQVAVALNEAAGVGCRCG